MDIGCDGVVSEDFDDAVMKAYLPEENNLENVKKNIEKLLIGSKDKKLKYITTIVEDVKNNKIQIYIEPKLNDIGNKHYVACYLREDIKL